MPVWSSIQSFGKRFPLAVFGALALVYLLTASGRVGLADSSIMLEVTRSLLGGHLALPEHVLTATGADGQRYSQFGLLTSLYWMPFVLLGRLVAAVVQGVPLVMLEEFFVSFSGVPIVLALLGYLVWEWRSRGLEEQQVRLGLWLVGLTTLVWPYTKIVTSDLLFALTVLGAWCHGRRATVWRHAVTAGVFLGLGLLCRKQAQTVMPVIVCYLLLRSPRTAWRRAGLGLLTGFLPPLLVHLAYNYARWGNPFLEVYAFVNAEAPAGLLGWVSMLWYNLFGSYQGLFLFSPVLLAMFLLGAKAWWRAERLEPLGILLLLAGQLLLFAYFGPALGPISFGARLLVFMIPLLALAWPYCQSASGSWKYWLLAVFAAAGFIVQVLGVTTDALAAWQRRELAGSDQPILAAHAAELVRVMSEAKPAATDSAPETVAHSSHPAFQCVDFWWVHLYRHWQQNQNKLAAPP